jgi:hypothetical protein
MLVKNRIVPEVGSETHAVVRARKQRLRKMIVRMGGGRYGAGCIQYMGYTWHLLPLGRDPRIPLHEQHKTEKMQEAFH